VTKACDILLTYINTESVYAFKDALHNWKDWPTEENIRELGKNWGIKESSLSILSIENLKV